MTAAAEPRSSDPAGLNLIERVAEAIRAHNIEAIVVDTGVEAHDAIVAMIPEGAEVHSGKSKTLEDIGIHAELLDGDRYDAIRPRIMALRPGPARALRLRPRPGCDRGSS
jgi:hypothetical protein